jgi:uracil-DNA glycosylase family 4
MIKAIHLKRSDVYIANVVKCRPPENRNPLDDECQACLDFLRWQVKLINPKIIVCLGAVSSKKLIDENFKISLQRGQFVRKGNFYFMPTYHPSYLLRNQASKKEAWEDFKKVSEMLTTL